MNLGMQIGQSQRLEQNISPQMLQAAAILQKTSQELDIAINEELSANPLLEMDDEVPEDTGADESTDNVSEEEPLREMDFESGTLEDTADHDYDILDNTFDSDMERRLTDGSYDEDAPFKDLNAPSRDASDEWDRPQKDRDKSLQDNLRDQLRDWNGNSLLVKQLKEEGCTEEHFRTLVQYLIDSLDEDGFLQGAPDEVMMKMAADRGEDKFIVEMERVIRDEIPLEKASVPVAEAFHVLQGFTPRGIGARGIQECFIIQAQYIEDFPELTLRILKEHFDDLMDLRYPKIAKALSVPVDEVQKAVRHISKLTPHPGRLISNAPTQIKQVDLRVERKGGRFEVECTQDSWRKVKRLHVNKLYVDMLTDGSKLDKATREYILNNKRKAEEFISAANNRFSTMELVMKAIVKRQPAFFKNGPAFLKPMVLQDIASEVKRDLSTISRVTNGKYVETPFGIFELKDFFTSGVRQQGKRAGEQPAAEDAPLGPAVNAGEEGDEDVVGSARILEAIKDLVDGENKKKPLSDQAIADALAAQGIQVARRTVAKYREERLKILPARQRKLL
ncbi:MAG: RNA polymerase factor sigma-54 [Fibrobacter sp.]|nr:RNA polymerase factor sigma-54 [Fibrobacter sp.]